MEEPKIRDQAEDDVIDLDKESKSSTTVNQTKVSQLIRTQELTAKINSKWVSEAVELSLQEKDDSYSYPTGADRRSSYSDMKNMKMMMFTITLPEEYLVTNIKLNFNSIENFKSLYKIHNIEAFSDLTGTKSEFLRPLENQKLISVDPVLKSITINMYSFANSINVYYQSLSPKKEADGRPAKRNKNLFTYHGPFQDLNQELQKPNFQMDQDDLENLDNEVAMILK